MSEDFSIVVGTTGSGVFQSDDGGTTWTHSLMPIPHGPWSVWVDVRAVALCAHNPRRVYSGSHVGLSRSEDGGRSFEFITAPFDNRQVWSIAVHPQDPDTIFVGLAPFDSDYPIWRTRDGGKTWGQMGLSIPPQNPINGAIHVTNIAFHPHDPNTMYATIEIGGVFKTTDGGDNWRRLPTPTDSPLHADKHGLAITTNGTVFVTSPLGYYRSTDHGETFEFARFEAFPDRDERELKVNVTAYCRNVVVHCTDPNLIFIGTGDTTPGKNGAIEISHDNGSTWRKADLPVQPNTHIYHLATHPGNPDRIVAASHYGELYVTEDSGGSWNKLKREFSEIRGLAWLPR